MIVVLLKYVPYIGLWPCQNMFLHECYITLVWWDYISYTCAFYSYLGKKTSLSTSYTHTPHIVHGVMNLLKYSMIMFACLWEMRDIDSIKLIILVHDLSDTHTYTHILCVCVRAHANVYVRGWDWDSDSLREREVWGGQKLVEWNEVGVEGGNVDERTKNDELSVFVFWIVWKFPRMAKSDRMSRG